jgi:hypothetical protein
MSELNPALLKVKEEVVKEPRIVVEIDGYYDFLSSEAIGKYWKIGDPEVMPPIGGIGLNGITIGGLVEIDNQQTIIDLDSTSTRISQQLDIKEGRVSVPTMQVGLVDVNGIASALVSPGVVLQDILGRKTIIYLGFSTVAFPDEYTIIHKGIIDDVDAQPGSVVLNVAHPEQLKRQTLALKATNALNGAVNNSQTTITVDDTTDFLMPVSGPAGLDTSWKTYIRIEDEIMLVSSKSATQFTVTRAQLGTVANAHDDDEEVVSFYVLEGNPVDLALKLMHSPRQGPYASSVAISNFVYISPTESVSDAIFFVDANTVRTLGISVGDYLTITGATNGGNNVTDRVQTIEYTDNGGAFVRVESSTFTLEIATGAVVSFRSAYDSLPDGLLLDPSFVDTERHEYFRDIFLSTSTFRFYLKEEIETKEFIEKELYAPAGLYSMPREGRASVNYTSPPIPTVQIETLDKDSIKNPDKLTLKRSLAKNFYNSFVAKFDEDSLEDKMLGGYVQIDATSKTQIPVGAKVYKLESKGLRTDLQAQSIIGIVGNRSLARFSLAAEYIKEVKTTFSKFNVEVGDIVIFDSTDLNIVNFTDGTRERPVVFMEVTNRVMDIRNGEMIFELTNTAFNTEDRYAIISPASKVKAGYSTTQFLIEESYNSRFSEDEWRKWENYVGAGVVVRSSDYVTRVGYSTLATVNGNTLTLGTALAFTPLAGDILELELYSNQTDKVRLVFGFMSDDDNNFGDGKAPYLMI